MVRKCCQFCVLWFRQNKDNEAREHAEARSLHRILDTSDFFVILVALFVVGFFHSLILFI